MLHDITSGKDNIVKKKRRNFVDLNEKGRREIKGGLRFLAGCMEEGGGSFRCALCATGGVGGGLKIRKKCVYN